MAVRTIPRRRLGNPSVERLCTHHIVDRFACGNSELDEKLRYFHSRFSEGEDIITLVIVEDSPEVLAYLAIDIGAVEFGDDESESKETRYFLSLPAAAVDHSAPRGSLKLLMEAGEDVVEVRRAHTEWCQLEGIIAFPHPRSVLERYLRGIGFRPLGDNQTILWRPWDWDD